MSACPSVPENDPAQFLKIAGQWAALSTHADLWRWLQGDVQKWLAHEVMLVGWGDFRSGDLHYDIISSLPGVRTHQCALPGVGPLISYFRDCWVAAQHLPCNVDLGSCRELLDRSGVPMQAIRGMRTAFVYGIGDGRHCPERIFAALSGQTAPPAGAGVALKLLLPFLDSALRAIPCMPAPESRERHRTPGRAAAQLPPLSERERQIMVWVALGKTNPEIGCILHISEFTVKNHLKSVFCKLDVTNRAQAAAKLTRLDAYA